MQARSLSPEAESGDDPRWFTDLRRFFEEEIPFNRFLGLRLEIAGRGDISIRLPFRPDFIGDPFRPALHGGTISTLIDTAGGAAVYTAIDPTDRVSTVDMRVDYLQPGAPADIWAEAQVIRLGGHIGVARVQVWQEGADQRVAAARTKGVALDRRLVAEGTGVYAIKRGR